MSDLINNCFSKIKKLFEEDDTASKNSRIESASITSNRLKALQRMRENSPTTPDYKLGSEEVCDSTQPRKLSKAVEADPNIDLDFGMQIGKA